MTTVEWSLIGELAVRSIQLVVTVIGAVTLVKWAWGRR